MNRKDTLKEMKEAVGEKEPVEFFAKLVDVLDLLFDRIDELEKDVKETRINTALAIQWEPRVAAAMLADQINVLREDKDTYIDELNKLKQAFMDDKVTQNYHSFCKFWEDTLGWHPFLEYK